MNQASLENQPTGNWYLFIGDGICLKVSSDLSLGEDEEGLVVLNPKQARFGLLKIRRDEDGRLLLKTTSKRHVLDWQTGTATMVGGEFALVAGSKIVLPNNEIYLSHEMQRGQVSARIIVQESVPVNEQVEVLVEVVPEAVARSVDGPQSTQPAPVVTEKLLDQEVFAEPVVQKPATPEVNSSAGKRKIVPIAVALSLCLVVGFLIGNWPAAPKSGAPTVVTGDESPIVEQAEAVQVPAVEQIDIASPLTLPEPSPQVPAAQAPIDERTVIEPGVVVAAAVDPAAVDPAVTQGLARAMAYLEQGLITQPEEGNAVLELSNILWQDPTNKAAFDLMGIATTQLIDAAVEAHSAGLEYEARNLIEEVLGFNPQHPQANAYQQAWAGN